MPFVDRGEYLKPILLSRGVARRLEIFRQPGSIETQVIAVGAEESGLVGETGQIFQPSFLDRQEVDMADAQIARNVGQAPSQQDPGLAQACPHVYGIEPLCEGVIVSSAPDTRDRPYPPSRRRRGRSYRPSSPTLCNP